MTPTLSLHCGDPNLVTQTSDLPRTSAGWHRHVLRLAFPIVLANLTPPILSAVDTAIAGHLPEPAALGAVALGGLLFNFIFWAFGFLRMGTTALTAQAHGAGDALALRANLLRGLLLALLIGALVWLLRQPLIEHVLAWLGGSDIVQTRAQQYSFARIGSAPVALANYVILGYLLGIQKVRVGLLLQLLINLANIVAVLICVYGFDRGVAGIGLATALADTIGFAAGIGWLWSRRTRHLPAVSWSELLDLQALRRLLLMNVNLFLRTICLLASFGWFARAGASQGDTILAANALLLNFQTFMAYALDGFAHAAETLVGAAVGARDRVALRAAIRTTLLWSAVGAALFSLVYALTGGPIIRGLTDQTSVIDAAMVYLPWAVVSPLVSVLGFQLDGVFIGATRTRELMLAMAGCAVLFIGLALCLLPLFGNHGLWAALTIFMAGRGLSLAGFLPRLVRGVGST